MTNSNSYNLQTFLDNLDKFVRLKSVENENERKKRGRPPKKENSNVVKELQKILQTTLLKMLNNEFQDIKDVSKKIIDILNNIILIIVESKLLENFHKKNDENDHWEKVALDSFSLIEKIIQINGADRGEFGKLCLKSLSQILLKSNISIDIRRNSADVINALLTGCKDNKKLLSQDQFLNVLELVSSMISAEDYELQLRHLEILFRLCPRIQDNREIFANKAFFVYRDMIPKFLEITANGFFEDSRNFLNAQNENNDGITNTPKTFRISCIIYNQKDLHHPEGQNWFFVDFNKYTISITVKSREVKPTKLREPLKLIDQNLSNEYVFNLIFDSHEDNCINDIKRILDNRQVFQKTQQSKQSNDILSLELHSSFSKTAANFENMSKSSKSLETVKPPIYERNDWKINNISKENELPSFPNLIDITSQMHNNIINSPDRIQTNTKTPSSLYSSSSFSPTSIMQIDYDLANLMLEKSNADKISLKEDNIELTEENSINLTNYKQSLCDKWQHEDDHIEETQGSYRRHNDMKRIQTKNFISNQIHNEDTRYDQFGEESMNYDDVKVQLQQKSGITNINKINKSIISLEKEKRKDYDEKEYPKLESDNYRVMKRGRNKLNMVNYDTSVVISDEEEFWKPRQNNCQNSVSDDKNGKHERLQALSKHSGSDDDDKISRQDVIMDNYILCSRESSTTIEDIKSLSTNNPENNKVLKERENEQIYITDDDNTLIAGNDLPHTSNVIVDEIRKFTDESLDEEIRNLLKLVGETIFKQFQQNDIALYQTTKNIIIKNEKKLSKGLEKQFERNNFTSIVLESQQILTKLKEEKIELENLRLEMGRMEIDEE
ncbi:5384_t:CDS:10 [Diversispora eburnea]|uniref:5384_t:CDS:1 n=1 Tax=Diversispora eburnea TaxID=1213867 RepID=A0A9N8V7J0_9GLOM|nr:5384_t:CDS:10 [Diversispora eburnea]